MDEIDLLLLRKLFENCRLTYRELAELVDMSVSAIHKRINKLEEEEIIDGYVARPSVFTLKSIVVVIMGTSSVRSIDDMCEELGQHENIHGIATLSGKFMYITGMLRDISELQEFSSYATRTANISEPTIGIVNLPYITSTEHLTIIDYKILKSVNKDARKPITDIADEVGLSPKTVKKRLDRMVEHNLATFSINWSQKAENNVTTALHIYLNEGTNLDSTMQTIYQKYNQNITFMMSFSNIPNFFTIYLWTKTAQDSQKIQGELQTEGFKDIIPHIFFDSKIYDDWIDQLLRTK